MQKLEGRKKKEKVKRIDKILKNEEWKKELVKNDERKKWKRKWKMKKWCNYSREKNKYKNKRRIGAWAEEGKENRKKELIEEIKKMEKKNW